jgi:hypothetical protein
VGGFLLDLTGFYWDIVGILLGYCWDCIGILLVFFSGILSLGFNDGSGKFAEFPTLSE